MSRAQAHPYYPLLASCGAEPAVRLWSPEAEEVALPSVAQRDVLAAHMLEVGRSQRLSRGIMGAMQVRVCVCVCVQCVCV